MSPPASIDPRRPRRAGGFTLVEMLVSVAILSMIMILLTQTVSSTSSVWTRSVGKVQAFQGARAAFEALTRNLAQATLQNYYGYADASGNPVPLINPSFTLSSGNKPLRSRIPARYLRASELHFLSGPATKIFQMAGVTGLAGKTPGQAVFFQAPVGFSDAHAFKPSLLNSCGYYVQFERNDNGGGQGTGAIPTFSAAAPTFRYRLMEVMQPAESNGIYQSTGLVDGDGLPTITYDLAWVRNLELGHRANRHVLADNVPLLVFLPKLAPEDEALNGNSPADGSLLAPKYHYDSRSWSPGYAGEAITRTQDAALTEKFLMNRLPPIVRVLMVAIDDRSAARLTGSGTTPPADLQKALHGASGTRFTDAKKYAEDVAALQENLDALKINYRIFQTEVRLPNAAFGP